MKSSFRNGHFRSMLTCRTFCLICVAIVALSGASAGQETNAKPIAIGELPDSNRGRQVRAFLKAFNTGDENTIRAFVEANYEPEALGVNSWADSFGSANLLYNRKTTAVASIIPPKTVHIKSGRCASRASLPYNWPERMPPKRFPSAMATK